MTLLHQLRRARVSLDALTLHHRKVVVCSEVLFTPLQQAGVLLDTYSTPKGRCIVGFLHHRRMLVSCRILTPTQQASVLSYLLHRHRIHTEMDHI